MQAECNADVMGIWAGLSGCVCAICLISGIKLSHCIVYYASKNLWSDGFECQSRVKLLSSLERFVSVFILC